MSKGVYGAATSGISLSSLLITIVLVLLTWLFAKLLRRHRHIILWTKQRQRLIFPALGFVFFALMLGLSRWHRGAVDPLLQLGLAVMAILFVVRGVQWAVHPFKRWVLPTNVVIYLLGILGVISLMELIPDISEYMRISVLQVGKVTFSVQKILDGLILLILSLVVASVLAAVLESSINKAALNLSLRTVLSRLLWVILLFFAVLVGLSMAGIDLTVLSVFGGALALAIGLGLQRIAANYIAGISVLFDRSITIGQMLGVMLAGREYSGWVVKVAARYTLLREDSGREVLVPNELLVTTIVLSERYSAAPMRQYTALTITFESDVDVALQVMRDAARQHPKVKKEPRPAANLKLFERNGLRLELMYFIGGLPDDPDGVRSDLNLTIWRELTRRGIQMPVEVLGPAAPVSPALPAPAPK